MIVFNIIFLLLSLLFIGIINYKYSVKKGNELFHTYRRYLDDSIRKNI